MSDASVKAMRPIAGDPRHRVRAAAYYNQDTPETSRDPSDATSRASAVRTARYLGAYMKASLQPGIADRFSFVVPPSKTVPALYPEADEFVAMPAVFATGYLVGLLEWACIRAINPHIDWPREQTLGTRVDVSHVAATPPGLTVTVEVELLAVEGRKLTFAVRARDGFDLISEGTHERYVIDRARFDAKMADKAARS